MTLSTEPGMVPGGGTTPILDSAFTEVEATATLDGSPLVNSNYERFTLNGGVKRADAGCSNTVVYDSAVYYGFFGEPAGDLDGMRNMAEFYGYLIGQDYDQFNPKSDELVSEPGYIFNVTWRENQEDLLGDELIQSAFAGRLYYGDQGWYQGTHLYPDLCSDCYFITYYNHMFWPFDSAPEDIHPRSCWYGIREQMNLTARVGEQIG